MSLQDQEKRIQELQTIKATSNNLMGVQGKLGVIAKYLGEPIKEESSLFYTNTLMEDVWALPNEEISESYSDMPEFADMEVNVHHIGWLFDGTTSGVHLEIKYKADESCLLVHYRGYKVYEEIAGELTAYVPGDWEKQVDMIYKRAKQRQNLKKKETLKENASEYDKQKTSFLQKMKQLWGFQ